MVTLCALSSGIEQNTIDFLSVIGETMGFKPVSVSQVCLRKDPSDSCKYPNEKVQDEKGSQNER